MGINANLSSVIPLHARHRLDYQLLLALLYPCHPLAVTLGPSRKMALQCRNRVFQGHVLNLEIHFGLIGIRWRPIGACA